MWALFIYILASICACLHFRIRGRAQDIAITIFAIVDFANQAVDHVTMYFTKLNVRLEVRQWRVRANAQGLDVHVVKLWVKVWIVGLHRENNFFGR